MNVPPPPPPPPTRSRSRSYIGLAAVLGVGVIVAALILFLLPGLTPEEVARKWAADNVDAAGEGLAGFILSALGKEGLEGIVMQEIGGEWIEDRINEHLDWTFSVPAPDGAGGHIVIATASVDFQVAQPPINGSIRASLPFRLRIRGSDVLEDNLLLANATFDARFEGIDARLDPARIGVDTESIGEAVDAASDRLKGILGQ